MTPVGTSGVVGNTVAQHLTAGPPSHRVVVTATGARTAVLTTGQPGAAGLSEVSLYHRPKGTAPLRRAFPADLRTARLTAWAATVRHAAQRAVAGIAPAVELLITAEGLTP